MLIEAEIESKLIAKLAALNMDGVKIVGNWCVADTGANKNEEDESSVAVLSVAVNPRVYENESSPELLMTAAFALAVRDELDPTGAKFVSFAESITNKVELWQKSIETVVTDFTTSTFSPSFLKVDGGDCLHDTSARVWNFTQSFTLRGILNQAQQGE